MANREKRSRSETNFKTHKRNRSNTYSNQFENDESSKGSHSRHDSLSLMEDVQDTFDRLRTVNIDQINNDLSNDTTNILFDSLTKVYSAKYQSYIDTCTILTKTNLYFTSPINYFIWKEIRYRTKMDELIDDITIIEESVAIEMSKNMNLTDDKRMIQQNILPYFRGKTTRKIKINIILNNSRIKCVSDVFNISDHKTHIEFNRNDDILALSKASKAHKTSTKVPQIKYINCVMIENINMVEEKYLDEFMIFVFNDIPYIAEEETYDSKIITLQQYYAYSVINNLSRRKHQFCMKYNILRDDMLVIIPYQKRNITNKHRKCKILRFKKFKLVEPLKLDNPYCFKLVSSKQTDEITFELKSNNERFEWITHLDYAIKSHKYLNDKYDEIKEEEEEDNHIDIINDYTITTNDETKNDDEFSSNFSFGMYLNYWETGYDNSVIPKYKTLKLELVSNIVKRLKRKQYYQLYEECKGLYVQFRDKINALKAQDIGINNKKFNISKGEPVTINHLLSLKVYTDYTQIQVKFKEHCRKKRKDELLKNLIKRNREIAHWCRYIKECCTFYGKLMGKKMVVYTGLTNKLLFNSLKQHFECPLSTTIDINVANTFAKENGILLKMKRANTKTRYFDVSWFSDYPQEKERLIDGSSLRICDIFVKCKSSNGYVSAIHLFEKIIDGQFIDSKEVFESKLYSLIQHTINSDTKGDAVPHKYFIALFLNMIQKMKKKHMLGTMWINKHELNTIKHEELKNFLIKGGFFNFYGINIDEIHSVKQSIWTIRNDEYEEFVNKQAREYIESSPKQIIINDKDSIIYHLEACSKYSDQVKNCAFFLYLDEFPENISQINIVFDLCCILSDESRGKCKTYRHLMTAQWLSIEQNHCGSQVFPSKDLAKYTCISWKMGIKIVEIAYKMSESIFELNRETSVNVDNMAEALHNNNKERVLKIFNALYTENQQLKSYIKQKDEIIQKLKEENKLLTQSVNYAPATPASSHYLNSPSIKIVSSLSEKLHLKLSHSNKEYTSQIASFPQLFDHKSEDTHQDISSQSRSRSKTKTYGRSKTHAKFWKQNKSPGGSSRHKKAITEGHQDALGFPMIELGIEKNKSAKHTKLKLSQSGTSESGDVQKRKASHQ